MTKKQRMLLRKRRRRFLSAVLMITAVVLSAIFLFNGGKNKVRPNEAGEKNQSSQANTLSFEPGSGDVNGDGKVTAEDSELVLKASVRSGEISPEAGSAGDINGDGKITAGDARNVMRKAVGLPVSTASQRFFCPPLTENDVPENAKVIYLTFDDGPSAHTREILDVLDTYNVKATFFVIKNTDRAEMYGEIVNRGHSIALHSSSHKYNRVYSSQDAFFDDLNDLSDYIFQNTGVRTRLIRFPGGSSNTISRDYCSGIMSALVRETANRGYVYFDWNSTNNDAIGKTLSAEQIENAANAFTGKSPLVMLMHDAPGKGNTVKALSGIIENYMDAGYYFLPLNENSPTAHHSVIN